MGSIMNDVASSQTWHGTTILTVRKGGKVVVAGDGQVSLGATVIKANARKVRSLGKGDVIAGWDRGLVGMKVGGRRELVIPARLAYGRLGAPPAVRPGETLIFVVDLIDLS